MRSMGPICYLESTESQNKRGLTFSRNAFSIFLYALLDLFEFYSLWLLDLNENITGNRRQFVSRPGSVFDLTQLDDLTQPYLTGWQSNCLLFLIIYEFDPRSQREKDSKRFSNSYKTWKCESTFFYSDTKWPLILLKATMV